MIKNRKKWIEKPAEKAVEKSAVPPRELTGEQLDQVSGGASSSLVRACCNGKHIPKATLH